MKNLMTLIVMLSVIGCTSHKNVNLTGVIAYKEMLLRNRANIVKLSIGMTKAEVLETMGIFQAKTRNEDVPNPLKSEMHTKDDDTYEILFYMTRKYPPFIPIHDSQATPVVLKNGKVIGWGWDVAREVGK